MPCRDISGVTLTRDRLSGEYRGGTAYYLSMAMVHTRAATAFKIYGLLLPPSQCVP